MFTCLVITLLCIVFELFYIFGCMLYTGSGCDHLGSLYKKGTHILAMELAVAFFCVLQLNAGIVWNFKEKVMISCKIAMFIFILTALICFCSNLLGPPPGQDSCFCHTVDGYFY